MYQGPQARPKVLVNKKVDSSKRGWLTHAWIIRVPSSKAEGNASEIFGEFYVSKYAWTERGVQYRWMEIVTPVARIKHPVDDNDEVCEMLYTTGKTYHLRTSNIATEVENLNQRN